MVLMRETFFERSERKRREQEQETQEREQLQHNDTNQHTEYHSQYDGQYQPVEYHSQDDGQYQPVESHEPDNSQLESESESESKSSVRSLYVQMYCCEWILWSLAVVVIVFAAVFVAAKVPPALMVPSAITLTASAVQLIRPITGICFRPRSKSDVRPRKWTLAYLAVLDVVWLVGSVLMFGLYQYQAKKEREEDAYGFEDVDVEDEDEDEITRRYMYLAKRRGGGSGARGGGGGGRIHGISSYEDQKVPASAFYTCGGLAAGILYVPLSFFIYADVKGWNLCC